MLNPERPSWKKRLKIPAYRVGEAASYAGISPQTVAAWEKTYHDNKSVLTARDSNQGLNFLQLIEVAVVAELRRAGLPLKKIRDARTYFVEMLNSETPFATQDFKTDGVDILQDMKNSTGEIVSDKLLVASANGQLAWAEFLGSQFMEFRYGDGIVISWHLKGPKNEVMIDPKVSFGSPSVRGIMTRVIKNEWATGSDLITISEDYELPIDTVKQALEFEGIFLEEKTIH